MLTSDTPGRECDLVYGILCEACALEGLGDMLIGLDGEACDVFRLLENELRLGCGTMMGADLL